MRCPRRSCPRRCRRSALRVLRHPPRRYPHLLLHRPRAPDPPRGRLGTSRRLKRLRRGRQGCQSRRSGRAGQSQAPRGGVASAGGPLRGTTEASWADAEGRTGRVWSPQSRVVDAASSAASGTPCGEQAGRGEEVRAGVRCRRGGDEWARCRRAVVAARLEMQLFCGSCHREPCVRVGGGRKRAQEGGDGTERKREVVRSGTNTRYQLSD